jgi:hypothetical protein
MMMESIPQTDEIYQEFYGKVMERVEKGSLQVHEAEVGAVWRFFDNLSFRVIYAVTATLPEKIFLTRLTNTELSALEMKITQKYNNINNCSIGIILNIDGILFTLTGDLEAEAELAMVQSGLLVNSTGLKVPHHGSKTSSSAVFLEKVDPEIIVISVGEKNSYKHPSGEVLERLKEREGRIFRTDIDGEVVFEVDEGRLYYRHSD